MIVHMARSETMLNALAQEVRRLRKARGWSRRELAASTRISERFLAEIEGGRANPSLLRLADLAEALGTSLHELVGVLPRRGARRHPAIALLGLRGAGKSAVGSRLAKLLRVPLVELDARIEQETALSLAEIFEFHGERSFREREREVLERLLAEPGPKIIATGGGLVTAPETWSFLRAQAHTVWLKASPEEHWERVIAQGDLRPMAKNAQSFQSLCRILAEREELYRQAEITLETTGRSVDAIAQELAQRFRSQRRLGAACSSQGAGSR